MSGRTFDVIVIGCGGIGSAATYWLAHAGARVLALAQFGIGHHRASSQDHSHIIRRPYHDPAWLHNAGNPSLCTLEPYRSARRFVLTPLADSRCSPDMSKHAFLGTGKLHRSESQNYANAL